MAFPRVWWLGCVALLPALFAVWIGPVMPTHDGPKTLYAAHVWSHAMEPVWATEFVRSWPFTCFGFPAAYAAFERLFPWRIAAGLSYSLPLILLPVASFRLAKALAPGREVPGLIGVGLAFHWSMHMGFLGYALSLPLGLLTLALALEQDVWSLRREMAIYGLLLVTCGCHPMGGQIAAVGIVVVRVLRCRRRRIVRELGGTALGLLPVLLVTLGPWLALGALPSSGVSPWDFSLAERPETFFRFLLSGPWWRAGPAVCAAFLGLIGASISLIRKPLEPRTLSALAVASVGLAGGLLAPMNSRSWEYVQPRFLPVLVLVGGGLLPVERLSGRWVRGLALGLASWALAVNVWVVDLHLSFFREHRTAYAALGRTAKPGRTLLPVLALPALEAAPRDRDIQPVPHALFLLNLGQLYGIDRQAIVPYTFSMLPEIHMILSRGARLERVPARDYAGHFREGVDPKIRRSELVRLASYAPLFDDFLFLGTPKDVDELLALGVQAEFREKGLLLGQWRGCPVRIRAEGVRPGDGLLVGWSGSARRVRWLAVGQVSPAEWLLERGPCQGLWVRLERRGAPELRCEGAASDGRLEGEAGAEVVCRLAP